MSELLEEPKTHAIVTDECELRPIHVGVEVTHNGVQGRLIRYIPECGHCIAQLTLTEAREYVYNSETVDE